MMIRLFTILLVLPFFGFCQDFQLKQVNTEAFKKELANKDYSQEAIHLYLMNNYEVLSDKLQVRKYTYPDFSICAFKQEFEHQITYSEEQCREAGGISIQLMLPKTDRISLRKWIEFMYKAEGMDSGNVWNADHSKYAPAEALPGCYYEIIETESNTILEVYCGC